MSAPRIDTPPASDHDTASAHTPEKAQHIADDKAINEGRSAADNASLISDTTLIAQQEGIKPAFLAKVQVLNNALAEIGMGRYQYELFFSGGFGWFADNICEWKEQWSGREVEWLGATVCVARRRRHWRLRGGHLCVVPMQGGEKSDRDCCCAFRWPGGQESEGGRGSGENATWWLHTSPPPALISIHTFQR